MTPSEDAKNKVLKHLAKLEAFLAEKKEMPYFQMISLEDADFSSPEALRDWLIENASNPNPPTEWIDLPENE